MKYVPNLKTKYNEEIVPTLMKEFGYKSVMQAPRLEKIVINQGVGSAIQDKKILEFSLNEITAITGQKAVVGVNRQKTYLTSNCVKACRSV